jgi:hypothetical protein
MVPRAALVLLLVGLVLLTCPLAAAALDTSPSEILANPDRFDGQTVTLKGTVTHFRERVSRAGNAYYTFELSDGKRAIKVFSFGKFPCRPDAPVTVDGRFQQVKRQGRNTFYDEVEARSVKC